MRNRNEWGLVLPQAWIKFLHDTRCDKRSQNKTNTSQQARSKRYGAESIDYKRKEYE